MNFILKFTRKKEVLYAALAILFVILIISVAVTTGGSAKADANAIKKDAYKEVNQLVKKYYESISSGDTSTLKNIVVPFTSADEAAVTHKSELIESYNNVCCYTHKNGVTKNYYIVFAYYEIHFPDVSTPVPGLETLFISRDSEGKLYINNDTESLNDAEKSKLDSILSKVEVVALFDDVETTFSIALHSDEGVAKFFKELGGDVEKYNNVETTSTPNPDKADSPKKDDWSLSLGATDPPKKVGKIEYNQVSVINLDCYEKADANSTIFAVIPAGTMVYVKENLDNGYSSITYNDINGYVENKYIFDCLDVNDTVTGTCIYYSSASDKSQQLGNLTAGTTYERIRYYGNGYSQIKVNNTLVYVKTEELDKKK